MTTTNIIEKRQQKLERLKRNLQKQDSLLKIHQRKARIRQLIEWGGLVMKAGLDHLDTNTLLGAFLDIKEQYNTNIQMGNHWKKHGGAFFYLEKNSKTAVIVCFTNSPSAELKLSLRDSGLKWNTIRKEWQGHVNIAALRKLLKDVDVTIQEIETLGEQSEN